MPTFDLRHIYVAKYASNNKVVTYSERTHVGDAIECNIEIKHAEGRLFAESTLAEYMKLATGGAISIAVKYIPSAAQLLLYGCTESSRTVSSKTIPGVRFGAKDISNYVGASFYAPDKIDGTTKYTCVFVAKALFGPPGMQYKTKGDNIAFAWPTTTGEFLADDSEKQILLEVAIADTEADAIAWCAAVLGEGGGA